MKGHRPTTTITDETTALTHAQMMDAVRAHNERQIVALVRGLLDLAAAIPTAERGELDAEARRLLDQAEKLGIG